ncbi:Gfo/Idh/MocA family protein [Stigmatella aurantiaca]|uniref:Glucose--fructose oxidoreductase n=1 Tax=Stigmatella aurantiaca (strain DW4/3-1) TaxID=378806 RepID=Q09AG6_STIAD|nr:Gfo/Idh/MocA family oxidoreductase [Stigmatella aurantiaca]ADO68013.1 Glucose-fructose oxidoreductase [Stigmatella aurantiaca DW4/3-1]EAU68724.1 glucose--fructose oxidoreductase [Stigmatella aurantiaca DW4/3-1]
MAQRQRGKQGTRRRTGAKAKRQVGYAVVGLGHFAQESVLPAFAHARGNSRLVALVSGDAKKARVLGKKHGVPVFGYEQFEECLALPEVEAVYIVLPNTMHAEYAVRAARAGAHVLCEKPLATTEAECREMIGACEESDVRLMTAYRLHFEKANLQAVKAVREGKLGEPRLFSSTFCFQLKTPNIRAEADKGGGVLWDIGVYCVNAARYLFRAEPVEVFAFYDRSGDARFTETEEAASVVMRFPEGKLAAFNVSFGAEAVATYRLVGTQGELHLENAYEAKGPIHWTLKSRGKTRRGKAPSRDQLAAELVTFSDCILQGKDPEPDGWEGLADVRIVSALYESARTGKPVKLEPIERKRRPTPEQEVGRPPAKTPELIHVQAPAR